ncbi:MAG: hypothetical protein JO100_00150 [Pseudonocardia sp.]|nr:hypothetical protein [Pseudonocardia sp.]
MLGQQNQVLAALLTELNWSPRTLGRRINRLYGVGTVAESTPYHWRDSGSVPRPPLPTYVASVLARELGRALSIDELWQGRGRAGISPAIVPRSHGHHATVVAGWRIGDSG